MATRSGPATDAIYGAHSVFAHGLTIIVNLNCRVMVIGCPEGGCRRVPVSCGVTTMNEDMEGEERGG